MKQIVLASNSPRRKALLEQIGLTFIVDASNIDEENFPSHFTPEEMVRHLSLEKAKVAAKKYPGSIIIAADTTVSFNGKIVSKPRDVKEAKEMLHMLAGQPQEVITGMTVLDTISGKTYTHHVSSTVVMKSISEKDMEAYIATGEPMDKAGGYGIQEKGAIFVERFEGDFSAAVGLPLPLLADILRELEVPLFA